MEYVHVKEINNVYEYESGCTCPALVLLDNGCQAVHKYPRNPQGDIVLFNEFFSCSIAHQIGITTPQYGIGVVDEATLSNNKNDCAGIGFFSEYIPNVTRISPRLAKRVANLSETSRMVLLDEIINNRDRYESNVLVDINGPNVFMHIIDHSHAFGNPNWDEKTLTIGDYDSPYVWRENKEFYEMLVRAGAEISDESLSTECANIQARINEGFLDTILLDIPSEWRDSIGDEKIKHAKEYVLSRVNNIERICKMILKERGMY